MAQYPSPSLVAMPQPPPTPSPHSKLNQNSNTNSSTSMSFGSAGSPSASSHSPHIPFSTAPVHHAPNAQTGFGFGFGFGFGGSSSSASSSFGVMPSQPSTPMAAHSWNATASSSTSPAPARLTTQSRKNDKRRRDDDSDDDDEDMSQPGPNRSAQQLSPNVRQALPKRMRAGLGGFSSIGMEETSRSSSPSSSTGMMAPWGEASLTTSTSGGVTSPWDRQRRGINGQATPQARLSSNNADPDLLDKVDLGKMLASLDKSSLLSVIHKLMASSKDPTLPAQIASLLPAPSIESVDAALDDAERLVRAALPWGTGAREEYVWSRVRHPLGELVATVLGYAPFFVGDQAVASRGGSSRNARERPHPSVTFAFLQSVTVRLLRLEAIIPPVPRTAFLFGGRTTKVDLPTPALSGAVLVLKSALPAASFGPTSPDALLSTLAPSLLAQWDSLVDELCRAVNTEGRIFGRDVVLGWGRSLVDLGTEGGRSTEASPRVAQSGGLQTAQDASSKMKEEERALRTAMDSVRARFENGLGWLVGGSNNAALSGGSERKKRGGSAMDDEEEL